MKEKPVPIVFYPRFSQVLGAPPPDPLSRIAIDVEAIRNAPSGQISFVMTETEDHAGWTSPRPSRGRRAAEKSRRRPGRGSPRR